MSGIKLVPHVLLQRMAQMEKQINIRNVTLFNIVRTEMFQLGINPQPSQFGGLIYSIAPIK